MNPIYKLLDAVRAVVRNRMRHLARGLYAISGGRVTANAITLIGLLMHVPIAVLIARGQFSLAAPLLLVFGLFDTLDGEIARLSKSESPAGMLLDASTDRFKEVMLYTGITYALINSAQADFAVWAVLACGSSLCVSYVKAKGETAVAKTNLSSSQVNRLFQDGLLRFELRMFVLFVALLTNNLPIALVVIGLLASFTAVQRLYLISQKLNV